MNNTDEKNLSISELSGLNFLIKLKHFFMNLFSKAETLPDTAEVENTLEYSFAQKYADKTIDQIQVLYENGTITEAELPEAKLNELKELYASQIIQLDEDSVKFM